MANDDAVGRLSRLIQSQPAPPSVGTPRVVPGQVVGALRMAPPAVVQPIVSDLETRLGLKQIDSAALSSIGTQLVLFEVIGRQTVPGAAAALAGDPRVLLAQPNFVSETTGEHRDAMADLQYGPRMMNVLRAHDRATGKTVRVAVIDTGIDAQHPDLAGRIVQRANFASGNDAGEIHGTALAGIIAATADNGIGIFGVAPDAAIVAVRACAPRAPDQSQGLCTAYALARGLDFAIEQGARVINLSLAGPRDRLMARLIARAHAAGIVVVAAAGNLGPKAAPAYPAALETVIAVTAIDAHAAPYAAASQGAFVSVAAPGVEVLSTVPGGTFAVHTGTSMAAAHVSGVVALLLQAHPNLSPAVVKELLESTARALGPAKPSARVGHGLVDACRALDGAAGGPHSC